MTSLPQAFFSKSPQARRRFIEGWLAQKSGRTALHLHPKNLPRERYAQGVVLAAYEDITKTDVWLRINSLISDDTFLILENPSRYPKITSEKVKFLRRLSMRFRGERIITDIVPFTLSVEYLYTPYSYLGREILGYPHWYAFRENYQEIDASGQVVNGLDFPVLAGKAAPVTAIDYAHFLAQDRATVCFSETAAEHARYAEKKTQLFDDWDKKGEDGENTGVAAGPPQKIVTRLADRAHAFSSRRDCLVDTVRQLLDETPGQVIAVTNLQSYAQEAQRLLKAAGLPDRARVTSYQIGAEKTDWSHAGAVVYAESPIVHSFYRLDIEAALPPGCKTRTLLGTTGVDKYLHDLITDETTQIDNFCSALHASVSHLRSSATSADKVSL